MAVLLEQSAAPEQRFDASSVSGQTAGPYFVDVLIAAHDATLAKQIQEEEVQEYWRLEQERSDLSQQVATGELSRQIASSQQSDGSSGRIFPLNLFRSHHSKHVPRVNAQFDDLPEEVMEERRRLAVRLGMYALTEREVKADGNCLFRAVSDQLFRSPHHYQLVRSRAVDQLSAHPEYYAPYVPQDYAQYVKSMGQSGTWGDHVVLQALADTYGVRIRLLTSIPNIFVIEIEPHDGQQAGRTLFLSYWAEVHYNSVWPEDDQPQPTYGDKIMGSRRLHRLVMGV